MPNKVFKLVIDVDARKAKRGAAETTTAFNKLNEAVARYGKYAAAAGVAAAAMFARRSIQAAIQQAQAVAQVDAAIRSTGMSAGFTTRELEAMAAALQRQTIYGDEAILKMQSLLLTFKSIRGDEFVRTTEAVANLAIRMGSLESAALLLGKALDDPARRASELSRSGIVLSESQKDLIRQFEATGQRAKAQGIILDEVATQFGGAAEAAAQAAGGGIAQFRNAAGDLSEELGERLVPALDALGRRFATIAGSNEFNTFIDLLFRGYRNAINFATGLEEARQKMDRFAKSPFVQGVVAAYKALTDLDGEMVKFKMETFDATKVSEGLGAALDHVERELLQEEKALIGVQDALEAHEAALAAIEEQYDRDIQAIRDFYEELNQLEAQLDGMMGLTDQLFGYQGEAGGGAWQETIDGMIDEFANEIMGEKPKGALKVFGESLKDNVGHAMASAIGVALGGGDTNAMIGAFATAIGTAVGQAMTQAMAASMGASAGPVGMMAGAIIGTVLARLLSDTSDNTAGRMWFGSPDRLSQVSYLSGRGGGFQALQDDFEALNDTMEALQRTINGTIELTTSFNVAQKESGRVFLNLYNEFGEAIRSIEFGSFQEAVDAGMAHVFSSAIVNAEGPMAEAIAQVFANASTRGYQKTIADIEFLTTRGFSELADLMERAGIRQREADEFRAQVEQQLFRVQMMKLEAEFKALGAWNELLEGIFADLRAFAQDVNNFMDKAVDATQDIIDLGSYDPGASGDDWLRNMRLAVQAAYDFIAGFEKQGWALTAYRLKRTFEEWERRLREAGGKADDVNTAVKKLWETYEKALQQAWQAVLEPLRNFQQEMLQGSLSTRSLQQKFFGARSKFYELLERVRGGDTDAIQELAQAGGQYLELARQMFGTTDRYKQIFDEVYRLIDGILEDEELMKTAMEMQHAELMELLETQGLTASELAQMQVDELVRIRTVLEGHTRMIQDQTAALERLEAA